MVKEGLSAARNATFNLSETVLESAVQATKMVQNVCPHHLYHGKRLLFRSCSLSFNF